MTTLQEDILDIYNALVVFNNETLISPFPKPISVRFETQAIIFEQAGKLVRLPILNNYCLDLTSIKKSYLFPRDYDYLMHNLQLAINSGKLLKERTTVSPENYGFDIYAVNPREEFKGPDILSQIRFVSGNSWFTRLKAKLRFKL